MAIGLFINYKDEVVQMPVNPEKVEISKDSNNKTTEVIKLGEVNQLAITKLADISFESFMPESSYLPFVQTKNKFWKPKKYIEFFEKIRKEKGYFRFVVTDTQINFLATIESFEWYHQAGDSEDVYYSVKLKEYREYGPKEVKVIQQVTKPNKPAVKPQNKRPANTNDLTVGCTVIANGRLRRDSYGSAPGQTEVNAKRKVSLIVSNPKGGQDYPIHVTTLDGGWRGWLRKSEVRRV